MSRIKIGDEVVIKATSARGVVKGREVHSLNDNRVLVEYIVKTGTGWKNWTSCSKDELHKVVRRKRSKINPTIVMDAPGGYKVTLTGIVRNLPADDTVRVRRKELRIGYSICNPLDEYSHRIGTHIAEHRAKTKPIACISSRYGCEFDDMTVASLLKAKGEYMVMNFDRFVPINNGQQH